ncbi:MAG: signal peptidase II [Planctomycetes bacterium]|nr:signal peptidase II [Planctomycetota bacterium]
MRRHRLLFAACALVGAALDLVTKEAVFRHFRSSGAEAVEIIQDCVRFTPASNTGVIWGLFPGKNPIFTGLSCLAVPVILAIYFSLRKTTLASSIGLGCVLAGTLGNLYDRIFHESVRDFIDVCAIHWPVFNVADACICVGAGLFALEILLQREEETAPDPNRTAPPPPPPPPAAGA